MTTEQNLSFLHDTTVIEILRVFPATIASESANIPSVANDRKFLFDLYDIHVNV